MSHIPVLKKEVLEGLDPKPGENFVDCTLGEAGHSLAILEKTAPDGKILGIETDTISYEKVKDISDRLIAVNDSYTNLKEIIQKNNFLKISGILLDLGMSSFHIDESKRGFSFLRNEILDMRFNKNSNVTAEKIINEYSKDELENILKEYGQERFARRIAEKINETRNIRQIKTTGELSEIIKESIPYKFQRGKINPATRVFQALRIAVNSELNNLSIVLPQAIEALKPKGRLAIISFHSLEDRIVKNFLKESEKNNKLKIISKKPITPLFEEISNNHRARSAKLRLAVKI